MHSSSTVATKTKIIMGACSMLCERAASSTADAASPSCAHMPASVDRDPDGIVALLAEVGQAVEIDQPLLVMEAMKMEHTIRSTSAGQVTEFYFQPGELVDGDAELLNFETAAGDDA